MTIFLIIISKLKQQEMQTQLTKEVEGYKNLNEESKEMKVTITQLEKVLTHERNQAEAVKKELEK